LDTDDDSSIRKRESAARLKPWGLHPLSANIPSEFSHSLPAEASAQAGPFFEQPCLTAWVRPGFQNPRTGRYAEDGHYGADRSWVDSLTVEQSTCVPSLPNEIGTTQTRHCLLPNIL
jgi:hypothetical protein